MSLTKVFAISLIALSCLTVAWGAEAGIARIAIDTASQGIEISPDLIGVFFEDINYGADGGLYAELVQNRSFE
jgi:alpha-N-arabinofuranosidase